MNQDQGLLLLFHLPPLPDPPPPTLHPERARVCAGKEGHSGKVGALVLNTLSSSAPKTLVWRALGEGKDLYTGGAGSGGHCHKGLRRMGSSSPTPEKHLWEGVCLGSSTGPDVRTPLPTSEGTRLVPHHRSCPDAVRAGASPSPPGLSTSPMWSYLLQQSRGALSHQTFHPPVSYNHSKWPEAETNSSSRKRKPSFPRHALLLTVCRHLCCHLVGCRRHSGNNKWRNAGCCLWIPMLVQGQRN